MTQDERITVLISIALADTQNIGYQYPDKAGMTDAISDYISGSCDDESDYESLTGIQILTVIFDYLEAYELIKLDSKPCRLIIKQEVYKLVTGAKDE
jgi:hypothetical protein